MRNCLKGECEGLRRSRMFFSGAPESFLRPKAPSPSAQSFLDCLLGYWNKWGTAKGTITIYGELRKGDAEVRQEKRSANISLSPCLRSPRRSGTSGSIQRL